MAHPPPPGASNHPNGGYPPPNGWPYATINGAGAQGGGGVHSQQQQQYQQQTLPPHMASTYSDPTSLLSVYPIGMYAPTARIAGHFAPHTETLQSPASTSELYPQYAGAFQALSAPQNTQDMQMRAEMAVRLAQNLTSSGFSSYGNLSYAPPSQAQRSATTTATAAAAAAAATTTSPSTSSSSFFDPSQQSHHHQLPQSSSSQQQQQQNYYQYNNYSAAPTLPQPSFGQQASSPHLSHQQPQRSSSAQQYQPALAQQQYRQQPVTQPLPYQQQQQQQQQQYRQPSQSQSPQVQYQQPPQQSLSPQLQYGSPHLQTRLPSPNARQPRQAAYNSPASYQPLSLPARTEPSPVQYQQPLPSPASYQQSPVSSSSAQAQYYTPQAQPATSSSAQYQQYNSPVAHQPTQSQYQQPSGQPGGQAPYTSPPLVNITPSFSHQQYAQYQQQQSAQAFPPTQYSQPPQAQAPYQYGQPQHPQVQKLKSPPLQSPQPQPAVLSQQLPPQSRQSLSAQTQPQAQQQAQQQGSQQTGQQPQWQAQQTRSPQQQAQQQAQFQSAHQFQPLQSLPYALLPQNSLSTQPPTPVSLNGSPAPSITNEYFENYINRTLKIQSPGPTPNGSQEAAPSLPPKPDSSTIAPSALAVPPPSKPPKMPKTTVDPIAFRVNGPSPAKKQKSNSSSRQSPPTPGTPQKHKASSFVVEVKTLTPDQRKQYKSIASVSDLNRSTASMQSTPAVRDDESEDELEWDDSTRVAGDWDKTQFLDADFDPVFVTPTSGRTGDKDRRTSFQKLQSLLEDIFEESDAFPADPSVDEVSSSTFFEGLSVDGTQPMLSSQTIDKVIRYVSRLNDNKKRQRSKANDEAVPWDVDGLLRLFRMLDKGMRDAEEVEPFPSSGRKAVAAGNPSPRKKKPGKKASKEDQDLEASPALEMNDEELDKGNTALRLMSAGAVSALCCLTILDSKTIPKQLYSEDLLLLAVKTIRNQMTQVIFPVVEGLAGEKLSSNFLAHVVSEEASAAARAKASRKVTLFENDDLASIAQYTCGAVPHIAKLIARPSMSFSESLVIQTVYLAIGPLFVKAPSRGRGRPKSEGTGGPTWSVMKSLRADALGCLRGAFAKYEDQRVWIVEEILNSLGTNQDQGAGQAQTSFQLPDGRSISTLTALLLQLIQASSHGVGTRIRRLRSSQMDLDGAQEDEQSLAAEESRIMMEADQTAIRSTSLITGFLIQKASGNKNTKAAQDNDFKAILDTVVSDLLLVLYRPEWPAAALFIRVLCMSLAKSLEDPKQTAEASSAKNVALDYLGGIAARLRTLQLEMDSQPIVLGLDELIAAPSADGLAKLMDSHSVVQRYLASAARDDSMYSSSAEMTRIAWAQELQAALPKAASVLSSLSSEMAAANAAETGMEVERTDLQDREQLEQMVPSIRKAARDVWNANGGLFDINASKGDEDATQASFAIARSRELQKAFERILHWLLEAMGLHGVAHRSKALRGLTEIVVVEPDVLSYPKVMTAIFSCLKDPNTSVRDAAVELISKYIVHRSELAHEYLPILTSLMSDRQSGVGVRKRIIKVWRDMCTMASDPELRIKICTKLVTIQEDEDSINDMSLKSLTEILFPPEFVADQTADLVIGILEHSRNIDEHLERALEGISKMSKSAEHKDRFVRTIESLIERMPASNDDTSADPKSYIRAIYLLSAENPSLIDTKKADVLKDHLRTKPANNDELDTNELILKIFIRSLPFLPRAATNFANDLTNKLRANVGTPTSPTSLLLPVKCWAAVIHNITKNYRPLVGLLRSVTSKIPSAKDQQLGILQYISALVAEFGKLEVGFREDPGLLDIANQITRGKPLSDYLFGQFLKWSAVETGSQKLPVLCLAALFRGYPRLILDPKTGDWMTGIFQSDSPENKTALLNLLNSCMLAEAKRQTLGTSSKNVSDLIGSTGDLHESGTSTALIQLYIDYVFDAAKSQHHSLQVAAMNVLTFTVNQGLYHPQLLFPHLVSLESSEDRRIAESAEKLHKTLHLKHGSQLNVRYLEYARGTYEYQRTITAEVVGQRGGKPLLGSWWDLLGKDKRTVRLDFIKSVTRAFEFDNAGSDSIDPGLALYIADNLALFEYQHVDEVMLVVQRLSNMVSEVGSAVANAMEQGTVEGLGMSLEGKVTVVSEAERFPATRLANGSIVVALAILTKNLLLEVYNVTEDKCLSYDPKKKTVASLNRRINETVPLDYSRIPNPRGVETVDEYNAQRDTFLQMMREDGSMNTTANENWSM